MPERELHKNEYEDEILDIMDNLPYAKSPEHLASIIHHIFVIYFSPSPASFQPVLFYENIARKIWWLKLKYFRHASK